MKLDRKTIRRKAVLILLFPFLYLIVLVFRTLPLVYVRMFSVYIGNKFYDYADKSRERALRNLDMVYGVKTTPEDRVLMARAVFVEIIKSFFDYLALSHIRSKKSFFSIIEVKGEEHLRAAYDKGKGVICLIPHLSSWEFAAITPPMLGYETSAASKAMKQKLLENMIVKYRGRRGMKNITREGSYAKLLNVLNKGECLVLMIDQDTKVKGVFVDFMGKPAYTPLGASRLAMETGAAVIPMAITRKADDNYCFIIYPELPILHTGDITCDLLENTRCQTKMMEEIVRAYPTQWVWMHPRWKTTPESLEEYKRNK